MVEKFRTILFFLFFLLALFYIAKVGYLAVFFAMLAACFYPPVKKNEYSLYILLGISAGTIILYRFFDWGKNEGLIWALVIFSVIFVLFLKDNQIKNLPVFSKKTITILVVLLIILGSFLRIYRAGDYSLNVDEAISVNTALGLLETGEFKFISSGIAAKRAVLNTLAIASTISVFGDNELAARLSAIVFGIASLILIWLLAKQAKFKGGFWAVLALAISELAISCSHSARMYQQLQLFTLLSLMILIGYLKKPSLLKLAGLFMMMAAAFYSHRSAIILLPLLLLIIFWHFKKQIIEWVKTNWLAVFLILFVLMAIVFFKFPLFKHFIVDSVVGNNFKSLLHIKLDLVPFKHLIKDYGLLFAAAFVAVVYSWREWTKKYLAITWLLIALALDILVYAHEPHYRTRYHYFILPIFFLFAGEGLDIFLRKINVNKLAYVGLGVIFFLTSGFIINPTNSYDEYPKWKEAKEIIDSHGGLQPGDIIIAHPTSLAYYYFRQVDYWLVSEQKEINKYSDNGMDIYGGGQVLDNKKELKNILNTKHGYIIIEIGRYNFINRKLKKMVFDNTVKLTSDDDYLLNVWKF